MRYQLVFIPFYTIYTLSTHIDKNDTGIIIYTGHNEAERINQNRNYLNMESEKNVLKIHTTEPAITELRTETDDIVFIPNEKEIERVERDDDTVRDLMEKTEIRNVLKQVDNTETPSQDILFISGKNNENVEKTVKHQKHQNVERPITKRIKIDCKNLECNNTLSSVCGGREEEKKWKYRLFMNECYFRKVNCAFKYSINRYKQVPMDKCKNIGGRVIPKAFISKPPTNSDVTKTRRNFSSRRTLNMGVDGAFCGHSCPESCTEEYDPQCALSSSGQRRVFLNHCKLDLTSCLHGEVWQRRPLSECVGGKKADLRQNRGFIGWLQRVGVVDRRGKLVLS